jgi:hypothetical protein
MWSSLPLFAGKFGTCETKLEKFHLKSPSVITFYSISLLIYWAGLQKVAIDKEKLLKGAHKLK